MIRGLRSAWLLILLLVLSAGLTALHRHAQDSGSTGWAYAPGRMVLRPFGWMTNEAFSGLDMLSGGFSGKMRLRNANMSLKHDIEMLTLDNQQLQAADQENARLRSLLGMKDRSAAGARWIGADVISRHPMHWYEYVELNCGADRGVRRHSAALTQDGLVGEVIGVRPDTCDLLLLTDPSCSAGAQVTRTGDVGWVHGTGGSQLVLTFFEPDHGVQPGDEVVASPFSTLYPGGTRIGVVVSVSQEQGTTARSAIVQPAVSFNNLEEVVVIP